MDAPDGSMDTPDGSPVLRIGELSRRAGVSDHVLRAWESRYGLLQPVRSAGGFRLYSEADALRVRRMQAHLARGLSAAEAAQAVLGEDSGAGADPGRAAGPHRAPPAAGELSGDLRQALDAFDEPAAQAVLDRLVSDLSLTAVLRDVVLPYLAELGERWERGTASVAQEHFATNVIRGRLAGLARGWGNGHGPRAVLACPPGELHDLALMVFGIVLHRSGWRIDYLGMRHPGRGADPDGRREAPGPRRPGRDPAGEPRAPRRAAHRARPARSARPGRSRRHAADRGRRGGPAADRRPSHRGREYSVAAVNALAGGASGFVDSRPCPALAENGPAWPRQHATPAATTAPADHPR